MANNNELQLIINLLIKNKQELDKVLSQLQEEHGIEIDTSDADEAFAELEGEAEKIEDKEIDISANGEDAKAEIDEVGSEIDQIDDKDVTISADASEAESEAENAKSAIEEVPDSESNISADSSGAVDAANEAESAIEQIPEEHETEITAKSGNTLQTLANVSLAYQGLLTVVSQVKDKIDELVGTYQTQEKADNDLLQALKQRTDQYNELFNSLSRDADAIQQITTVGDESAQRIMAAGLNMGIAISDVNEATEGAIGLAKKYETVGLSQETALKGIALAFQANEFTMLNRYIPALRAAETDAEKMAILKKEMADGFKLANAEIETSYGKMQQYKNEVGDTKEMIGEALVPVLLKLQKGFLDVTKSVMDFLKLTDFKGQAEDLKRIANIQKELSGYSEDQLVAEKKITENQLIKNGAILRNLQQIENINETGKQQIEDIQKQNSLLVERLGLIDDAYAKIKTESEDQKKRTEKHAKEIAQSMREVVDKDVTITINKITKEKTINENDNNEKDTEVDDEESLDAEMATENERLQSLFELKKEFHQRDYELNTSMYQQQMDAIDDFYEKNKEQLINAGFSEQEILEQSEQAKQQIRSYYANRAVTGTSQMFGNLAKAFKSGGKQGFEAYKVFAISQAIIDTYKAANSAYSAMAGIPVIGPALGAAAAGAAIAAGMANVKAIEAQKFSGGSKSKEKDNTSKAAKGTILDGPSHSQGGINVVTPGGAVEAEGGEPILTARTSQDPFLLAMASLINQKAGGDPLPGAIKPKMQSGGSAPKANGAVQSNNNDIINVLKEGFRSLNRNIAEMPKPVVNIKVETSDPEARVKTDQEVLSNYNAANGDSEGAV